MFIPHLLLFNNDYLISGNKPCVLSLNPFMAKDVILILELPTCLVQSTLP